MRVGLISDTHGLLRPEALALLQGCDHIIHAGDICDASVLQALSRLAPVIAVRGNNDKGAWAAELPEADLVQLGDAHIYVVHDLATLNIDLAAAGVQAVISGHSHQPLIKVRDGILFVNPGSAGPRRFKLPVTIAELSLEGTKVSARILALDIPGVA